MKSEALKLESFSVADLGFSPIGVLECSVCAPNSEAFTISFLPGVASYTPKIYPEWAQEILRQACVASGVSDFYTAAMFITRKLPVVRQMAMLHYDLERFIIIADTASVLRPFQWFSVVPERMSRLTEIAQGIADTLELESSQKVLNLLASPFKFILDNKLTYVRDNTYPESN